MASGERRCCRICFEEDAVSDLIWPCRCKGSMREVHAHCLEQWLKMRGRKECEVCHTRFNIKLTYPSLFKIGFELLRSLWTDKTKLLRIALLGIYGQFLYKRLMAMRSDFLYLARGARRNWYKVFLIGVVFGIYYAQLVFVFFKESFAMLRALSKIVKSTAHLTIANYY